MPSTAAPSISVVVPSFNQARFLGQALDSILGQDYPALEIIVMDGGSTDGSVDLIGRYEPRLTAWRSGPDGGQAAAINAGVALSTGEIVAWLNSDDWYLGHALWAVARAWLRHPGAGLYLGNGLRYLEDERAFVPFTRRHVALNRAALRVGRDYVLQPATFFSRRAWEDAGGLRPDLRWSLDWDVVLRIAGRFRAVLLQDQLAVSREHPGTKTHGGGRERCAELERMIASHTDGAPTLGTSFYALECELAETPAGDARKRRRLKRALSLVMEELAGRYGNADGFPEAGDPGDVDDLPQSDGRLPRPLPSRTLPSISIVTSAARGEPFPDEALESITSQRYPDLTTIPAERTVQAVNRGLGDAAGEVLGWLDARDRYAADALAEVGTAFALAPDVDLVVGNAVYVDGRGTPTPVDHGASRSALFYGDVSATFPAAYWEHLRALPEPAVFFRRRLFERCGGLDESYGAAAPLEMFWRYLRAGKALKVERTLALFGIDTPPEPAEWTRSVARLYQCSRPMWPSLGSPASWPLLRSFLRSYSARHLRGTAATVRWLSLAAAGAAAVSGLGNPEDWPRQLRWRSRPGSLPPRRP